MAPVVFRTKGVGGVSKPVGLDIFLPACPVIARVLRPCVPVQKAVTQAKHTPNASTSITHNLSAISYAYYD